MSLLKLRAPLRGAGGSLGCNGARPSSRRISLSLRAMVMFFPCAWWVACSTSANNAAVGASVDGGADASDARSDGSHCTVTIDNCNSSCVTSCMAANRDPTATPLNCNGLCCATKVVDGISCDGVCVDPSSDDDNCGTCGHRCNPDGGTQLACTCPPGTPTGFVSCNATKPGCETGSCQTMQLGSGLQIDDAGLCRPPADATPDGLGDSASGGD